MALSSYLALQLLNHVYGGDPYTSPETVYLGLLTEAPTELDADGVEVTGGSYARKVVTFIPDANGEEVMYNDIPVTFTGMPACTIVAAALYDSIVGSNMLHYNAIDTPYPVAADDNLSLAMGDLSVTLA